MCLAPSGTQGHTQEHTLEGRLPDLGMKKLEAFRKRQQRPVELERKAEKGQVDRTHRRSSSLQHLL